MLEDVPEFGAVQLGIGRHGHQTGVPDAVEQFEIVMRILGGNSDALAGDETKAAAQGAGKLSRAAGKFRRSSRQHASPSPPPAAKGD